MDSYRIEHDLLGDKNIPADVYYGIQTMRAIENFVISEIPISNFPLFIQSLAHIKKAAAITNMEYNILNSSIGNVIVKACDDIIAGKFLDQFAVDAFQGGAGTSTNMNANEVIANRALELIGRNKGEYKHIHPNNHVNLSQSTNDVYPTAIRITSARMLDGLIAILIEFKEALEKKGEEFHDVIKMGRTQLQDAIPMTLGQEFNAWAYSVGEDIDRLRLAQKLLYEINMGATAIGTGLNAPAGFAAKVTAHLATLTGLPLVSSIDLIQATQDSGGFIEVSGVLKRIAAKISKICNDLRLLSSGPRAGINEINLPPMQPGSSIMPGKVNPVIPEVVNQVAFGVIGNDLAITLAAEAGQLELNVMEPLIAYKLFTSIKTLTNVIKTLIHKCIVGITANKERCRTMVEQSIGLVTALVPYLGYEVCSDIAKKALDTNEAVYTLVLERKLLSEKELNAILSPESMLKSH
ncbi:MAG: aspartate ammonia-lyase [Sphaerochaetaceae bacterium]|jgi:aspartate ammonia-lyase|nr:aspartate ammonia-lyase [Sphaerochaetaceae bacterium]NLO60856.1 aspartate ammonia-lyase [Spirochaetales bacterium]MDD2406892.1 aspartate ammonia-lyase [Sphaerochaetaceae bacterium]MDD3671869.1 aspartate ammonia-lyase [Sphaerochaetaceae bacterium]MDD4259888.1 aspartate ammonia-lyase [Sphaerochaetaceae bacterium]